LELSSRAALENKCTSCFEDVLFIGEKNIFFFFFVVLSRSSSSRRGTLKCSIQSGNDR